MQSLYDILAASLAGRYEIGRTLGRGGSSIVFLAQDLRVPRQVAIKILRPELTASTGAERFLREIRIVAGLQHPHILHLYDRGELDGIPYFVMPYVKGVNLRDRMKCRNRLSLNDAISITSAVAEALDYAHGNNVIHRDIKPENILLLGRHVYVVDFGIALARAEFEKDHLTGTLVRIGTPHYMSPEQACGEEFIDGRSDQYSLACVLYEMLADRPPFNGREDRNVIGQHIAEKAVPLSQLRPNVGRRVCAAVTRALAKAPEDRFETTRAFVDELRTIVEEREKPPLNTLVVLPFTNIGGPAGEALCDGITEDLTTALANVTGLRVVARTSAMLFKAGGHDVREVGETLNVAAILEGSVRECGSARRITAQLIDASDGYHLSSAKYDRKSIPGIALEDQVVDDVVHHTVSTLGIQAPQSCRRKRMETIVTQ